MLSQTACDALKSRRRLELNYNGLIRVVEVHAVGFTQNSDLVARVWQVRGGSADSNNIGWKLLRLEQASGGAIINETSDAPRAGYKVGDRAIQRILCEV
jgi:hypothetical protein